jgi:uncharacterized tellurite resistance protein B-like protein
MIDSIRTFFAKNAAPEAADAGPDAAQRRLRVAACALLLEMAHADADFSEAERRHIEEVVRVHFALDARTALELIALAEAERREAVGLHEFTSLITRHYDEGQRMVLAELLWRVVYADGTLSERESMLARRLASLLELRPGYLSEARKRAQGDSDGRPPA